MSNTTLHLRAETKPLEHRSALTPTTAKALIDAGYTVNVERSKLRIFDDTDFEKIGARLLPEGSWPEAPSDHIIIGLKELPENETFPLKHTHVQFAHCYKGQGGWQQVLGRFPRGDGTLLDLEFLTTDGKRNSPRVAAFGYHAGFAGAALAVQAWSQQLQGNPMSSVKPCNTESDLLNIIKQNLAGGEEKAGKRPRAFVMGAKGRCGRGAVELFEKIGLPSENVLKWDIDETRNNPGPYQEINESDIFVNCIYLSAKIPPFIDPPTLSQNSRKLSVVCDVSCDTTNPHNPIPIYSINTTFDKPTVPVEVESDPPLSVISIDHLPSLLPREASEAFSSALLPYLVKLKDRGSSPTWQGAQSLFEEMVDTLPAEAKSNQNGHA